MALTSTMRKASPEQAGSDQDSLEVLPQARPAPPEHGQHGAAEAAADEEPVGPDQDEVLFQYKLHNG